MAVSRVCLETTGPARREEAETFSCDTISQGQCHPQGKDERQLLCGGLILLSQKHPSYSCSVVPSSGQRGSKLWLTARQDC